MSVEGLTDPIAGSGGDLGDVEFIRRGGSAVVYRAVQRSLGRMVAIKVLEGVDLRDDGLEREASMQAAMSWHSNVVTLLGTTELADGRPALVLEYLPGGSLMDRVVSGGPLAPSRWRRLGGELSRALAAAHNAGFVHRDVKPSNVLFAADGTARLGDFGLAAAASSTLDDCSGSVAYAPPELLEGSPATPANDVYSLALTLLVAATGRVPFGADHLPPSAVMARVQSERLRFSEIVEGVEPELAALLDASLDPDPGARPTAVELAAAFERQPLGQPMPKRVDRRRWVLAAGGVAVVLALAATVLAVGASTRASSSTPVDLCGSFRTFAESRQRLFDQVSADLEQATSPVDVVERLLVQYPAEWAAAVGPYLQDAARVSNRPLIATNQQLADLTRADVLRALSGGKPFLFDGQSGAFDPSTVPAGLRDPASSFSEANELGASACAEARIDLSQSKARMYSAIYSNLANPEFMSSLFDDPRSLQLLDVSTVLLMNELARPFFETLIDGRWDWFFDLMESSPDVRAALAAEAPDLVLQAGSNEPDRFESMMTSGWKDELKDGYRRLGTPTRAALAELYPEQVRVAGLN